MAIYRPAKPRYRLALIAAACGLVAGLIGGLVLGGGDPEPVEVVREIRVTLTEASSLLEIVEIEYAEALEDGSGEGEPEYQGAVDALARSRARWDEARPSVELLDPTRSDRVDDAYDELDRAVDEEALPEEVNELTRGLTELLEPGSE